MTVPEVVRRVCSRNDWPCQSNHAEGNHAEVELASGRLQKVFFAPFKAGRSEMLRAYSIIGDASELPEARLRAALTLNFNLPHGALAIQQEQLVMTDTFLIKDADEDEVEASLQFLAENADRYEKVMYGTDDH